jgi:hypothetical protein
MKAAKQLSLVQTDTSKPFLCDGDERMLTRNTPLEETIMISCFAVFPDGAATPAAVFADLEDAMDWGLERYGGDAFGIRHLEMAQVERAERHGAPGPA